MFNESKNETCNITLSKDTHPPVTLNDNTLPQAEDVNYLELWYILNVIKVHIHQEEAAYD